MWERCKSEASATSFPPDIGDVFKYRKHVDRCIKENISLIVSNPEALKRLKIGINHEEQHIELLITDLKYNFYKTPLQPALYPDRKSFVHDVKTASWHRMKEGLYEIGANGDGFFFDNETAYHRVFLEAYDICDRLVTNAEFIEFIEDNGYKRHEFWLSLANEWRRSKSIDLPLYWKKTNSGYMNYTLAGWKAVDPNAPVTHLSYFEADAFACWKGFRLPTEFEWEAYAKTQNLKGGRFLRDPIQKRQAQNQSHHRRKMAMDKFKLRTIPRL